MPSAESISNTVTMFGWLRAEAAFRGSDGFTVQADVSKPADVDRLFARVGKKFGGLDIFVANARGEVGTFFEPAMTIGLDK